MDLGGFRSVSFGLRREAACCLSNTGHDLDSFIHRHAACVFVVVHELKIRKSKIEFLPINGIIILNTTYGGFMEKVKWTKTLATGNEIMDKQHKIFLELCDNLDQSVNSGKSRPEIMADIKFLEDYALVHFNSEKKIMEDGKYPLKDGHLKLHAYFLDEMKIIRDMASAGETGEKFAKLIKEKVTDWFVIHIDKTDRKLGKYLSRI
jgi:hemerythrin